MTLRATKIVATLGPASSSAETLKQLIEAGVDVVRLNFSHGTAADHQARAQLVREVSKKVGREVAIMADLQGPKIRVGKFENNKIILKAGERFTLDANCALGNQEKVGLDYKNLPNDVKVGDKLLLNDGLLVIRVEEVQGTCIHTVVELGGELSNNKGINRAGGGLTAPALTDKDKEDLKTAVGLGADYIAISFPKNADDMKIARDLANQATKELGHKTKLIAKIERAEAVLPGILEEILEVSDGIMVARGDLAVEVGNATVPALQKKMIRMAREANKVVITATQMMESMIVNPVPTRAEVSDVANAVLDGTDAVMLSGETAIGQHPVQCVRMMEKIAREAEVLVQPQQPQEASEQESRRARPITEAVTRGAVAAADFLKADLIVVATVTGRTALALSRLRGKVPIVAFTDREEVSRRMCLYWGVTPQLNRAVAQAPDSLLKHVIAWGRRNGVLEAGSRVILVGHAAWLGETHDLMMVHVVP